MGFIVIVVLIILSLVVGTVSNSSPETTPSLAEETQAPLPTPAPQPTTKPIPSIPTSIPSPTDDYLSRLTKCLKDTENDPLNQEIKKDREILNNPNSTKEEKNAAIARLGTNNLLIALKYDCFGTNFKNHSSDDIETAWLIKDINYGDSVIVERRNGEQWLLEAKTWCSWCWRYEGRQIHLKFGYVTSKLVNDDGDVSEFWTEEEL